MSCPSPPKRGVSEGAIQRAVGQLKLAENRLGAGKAAWQRMGRLNTETRAGESRSKEMMRSESRAVMRSHCQPPRATKRARKTAGAGSLWSRKANLKRPVQGRKAHGCKGLKSEQRSLLPAMTLRQLKRDGNVCTSGQGRLQPMRPLSRQHLATGCSLASFPQRGNCRDRSRTRWATAQEGGIPAYGARQIRERSCAKQEPPGRPDKSRKQKCAVRMSRRT